MVIGAFSLGTAGQGVEAFAGGRGAAYTVFDIIDMVHNSDFLDC